MVGILLGLPGNWAEDELESSDYYTTKIGGLPDWPPLLDDTLTQELLNCCSCGSRLSLVAQVYAPISTENADIKERTLYIFGCLMPKCGTSEQSWRAFSVHKATQEKETSDLSVASPLDSASKSHWLDDVDGDDDDDEDFDLESLAKAIAEAATTVASNTKKPKSKKPSGNASSGTKAKPSPLKPETRVMNQIKVETGAVVPCFYIYSKEENLSKDMRHSSMAIKDKEASNNDESETEEVWEDEKYEYDRALNADRTYLKFKKRLDANPEQCFRYSYGGKPLLATEDLKSPDKCRHCDSPMLFEMQLMPPLIFFLHEAVVDKELKQSLDNWDWMTLIVYTCSKCCANAVNGDWVVAEECVAVQYEKPMNIDHSSFFK
ncbi:unnamed protein product [Thlaspi arvense]|uniref:Programmed cell death protein 2 C-terminal domain-containing protein n=1 Tax=Thlaspi arvense TaxID=13288 RepID=A0AAU9RLZ9_THLAR|nr:unnamed protein product [Thlaspi arvense]